jgi:hypothetical protein
MVVPVYKCTVMGILFRLGIVLTAFCAQNIKGPVESHETIWSLNQYHSCKNIYSKLNN